MKPEEKVKKYVREVLTFYTPYQFAVMTGGMGESGHPDRVASVQGCFLGIECKATGKQHPTPLQERRLRDLRAAGGLAFVVDVDNRERFSALMTALFEPGIGAARRIQLFEDATHNTDKPYWR